MEIEKFAEKLKEALELENSGVLTSATRFRELEDWSSLSVMSLIVLFDEEWGKEIGDKDIKDCQTIGDLYNLLNAK